MNNRILIGACLAGAGLLGLATAQAVPAVVAGTMGAPVYLQSAPPPPMYEAVPPPRAGFIWTPGYYAWSGDRYVWNGGRWVQSRPGYAWQEARWVQRGDGSWYLVGGSWVRTDDLAYGGRRGYGDRDHDGVPNRYDAYPGNPYRN